MKYILKSLLAFILCLTLSKGYAQLTTSFYLNQNEAKIALGYQFNDKWWADFRIYSGTDISGFTPEIVANYNFLRKDDYDAYVGAGAMMNYYSALVVPIGVAIKPFEKMKRLSLNVEFNPFYDFEMDDLFIHGFLGVRFRFK